MTNRLHLGCGSRKAPGSIGIDIYRRSSADVLADLNHFPYPFADNTFDEVICEHILEHLDDVVAVVEEICRISRPDARLIVDVPHFTSVHFYQDPTHRHAFTSRTFDYFVEGAEVNHFGYSEARLRRIKVEFPPPAGAGFVKRTLFSWINRHIDAYEKRVGFILPRYLLHFELAIVK